MHRVLFSEAGQTLQHVPARPVDGDVATYVIEDLTRALSSSERELGSGSATVTTGAMTTDDAAGPREPAPTKVPVASTSGAAAGVHWIQSPDGRGEMIDVASMLADDYLVAKHPLIGEYPAGSSVRPLQMTALFPDAHVSRAELVERRESRLRIVWQYEIDGRLFTPQEQIRVQRHVGFGDVSEAAVVSFVREAWPDLIDRIPTKFAGWVRAATRMTGSRLRAHDLDPARFLAGDRGAELVAARFVLHAAHNGEAPGNIERGEFLALAKESWSQAWTDLVEGSPGGDVADLDERDVAPVDTPREGGWTLEL